MRKQELVVMILSIPVAAIATLIVVGLSANASQDLAPRRDLGFEAGSAGQEPADWFVPAEGWVAELAEVDGAEGRLCAVLTKPGDSTAPFGNLMRSIDAREYQGRHLTLSARIRVEGEGGRAQMWLRADRPDRRTGAFDNMGDRPIFEGGWTDARIDAEVDGDAERLALGFMSFGGATLFIDKVELVVGGEVLRQEPSPPRALTPRGLHNVIAAARLLAYVRFFHPSDQAAAVEAWDHFAIHVIEQAEPASGPEDLARRLQVALAPIAPSLAVWAGGPEGSPAIEAVPLGALGFASVRHHGLGALAPERRSNIYTSERVHEPFATEGAAAPRAPLLREKTLGESGVRCRLPIELFYDGEGTLPHASPTASWSSLDGKPRLTTRNRSTRLAAIALCWGVMQHFYPYFDVVETDWDAALDAALAKGAEAPDERAFQDTLLELVAKLYDGHGGVAGPAEYPRTRLPFALAWADEELVVAGLHTSVSGELSIGDVILSIDGRPTAACYEAILPRISAATDGWRRHLAARFLAVEPETTDPVPIRLRRPDGSEHELSVARVPMGPIENSTDARPETGRELVPGIVYFDLDGAGSEVLTKHLAALVGARGIVFDLRGYPNAAAYELIPHLIDGPATSASWNVPIVTLPDREAWTWDSSTWQLEPAEPHISADIAFLTDGRAISYAESIMGIVEHYELGEIVGSTTAGTNGNVNPIELPGGFTVAWTGMRVLKHDGSRHHGVGILPTVPVAPTLQGIAEGRDEVLETAVDVLAAKIAGADR